MGTVAPAGEWEEQPPEPRRVFEVRTDPSPAMLGPGDHTVRVTASNLRGQAESGTLDLAAEALVLAPASLELPEVDRDRPFAVDVDVQGPAGPFAAIVRASARLAGQQWSFELPVIRLATSGEVAVTEADGVVTVDNGALRYRVVPAFGGSVTSLAWGGAERLRSAWPEPRPFVWADRWFGGIHPAMGWIGGSYLARESFTGGPVERTTIGGTVWRGAQVACQPSHRDRRWLGIEAEYLTLPGSNVLAVVTRWTNRTSAEIRPEHEPCLAAWLAPGGEAGTESYWIRSGHQESHRAGPFSQEMLSDSWAAVADVATGTAVMMVPGGRQARAYVEDFAADGQHLGVNPPMTLRPGETREVVVWLVLCRTEEMAAYAALRDAWPGSADRTPDVA